MPDLEVEEVRAGYGSVQVLNGVSMRVGAEETVALLGPNGSGKSTLAKTIMNLTTLYQGRVLWEGRDIGSTPTWRRAVDGIGYVPQVDNVFVSLRVDEQLALGGRGLPRAEVRPQTDVMYQLFPLLAQRRRVTAGNLSGGERRMLAIATILMRRPRLLILDEPTSDLAPAAIDTMFEKVRQIREEFRIPLLLVEQNVRRALEIANRVCVLIRGAKAVDKPCHAITEEELGQVFLERRS